MWGAAKSRTLAREVDGFELGPMELTQFAQMFSFLWTCSLFLARERMEGVGRWSVGSIGKGVSVEAVGGGTS